MQLKKILTFFVFVSVFFFFFFFFLVCGGGGGGSILSLQCMKWSVDCRFVSIGPLLHIQCFPLCVGAWLQLMFRLSIIIRILFKWHPNVVTQLSIRTCFIIYRHDLSLVMRNLSLGFPPKLLLSYTDQLLILRGRDSTYEPRCEKSGFRGFRPGLTQTRL